MLTDRERDVIWLGSFKHAPVSGRAYIHSTGDVWEVRSLSLSLCGKVLFVNARKVGKAAVVAIPLDSWEETVENASPDL